MKKQLFLIAFFTVGLALIQACSCFTSCGCGGSDTDAPEFFDFKKITLDYKTGIGTESLRFVMAPDSIEFLAMEAVRPRWDALISSAYACSPTEAGSSGLKFPITQINITADQVFNDTLPAGASLNALFQMATLVYDDQINSDIYPYQLTNLNDLDRFPPFSNGPSKFYLITKALPVSNTLPFKFTITLNKSDSSMVSMTSGEIFF